MFTRENGVVYAMPRRGRLRLSLFWFFVVAFALSWAGAAPLVLSSWAGGGEADRLAAVAAALAPLQPLMLFGTLIAAVAAATLNYGWRGPVSLIAALLRFRVSPIWYLIALASPAALAIAASLLARRYDQTLPPFDLTGAMLGSTAQIFAVYLIANTEEIAWRGYALPHLQRTMSPLAASAFLSLVWGVFHCPLFLMKGGHPAGYSLALFALLVFSIGLLAGALFNTTRGSVLICHLLHQSLNAWGEGMGVFPTMNDGSVWPVRLMTILLAVMGAAAAIYLATLRRTAEASELDRVNAGPSPSRGREMR